MTIQVVGHDSEGRRVLSRVAHRKPIVLVPAGGPVGATRGTFHAPEDALTGDDRKTWPGGFLVWPTINLDTRALGGDVAAFDADRFTTAATRAASEGRTLVTLHPGEEAEAWGYLGPVDDLA